MEKLKQKIKIDEDLETDDFLIKESEKIFSNFIFLLPEETTDIELALLSSSTFKISLFHQGDGLGTLSYYYFKFYVPLELYKQHFVIIPNIEKHLNLKAKIIFNWFPGCALASLKITPLIQEK